MYRKAHWKVYKVFIWEDSSQERWRRPQSNGFVLFQTLIIDIYQLHWSLEYMYIHKTTINLLGVSAIIFKNISQYCCMYNNRIYIEKFYCTYILSITSVTSYPQRHQAHKRYSRAVTDLMTSCSTPYKVQQPIQCLLSRYGFWNMFTQLMISHTKIDVV